MRGQNSDYADVVFRQVGNVVAREDLRRGLSSFAVKSLPMRNRCINFGLGLTVLTMACIAGLAVPEINKAREV